MPKSDKRDVALLRIKEKIAQCETMTQSERDQEIDAMLSKVILNMHGDIVAHGFTDKYKLSTFNSLQNAVYRREIMNKGVDPEIGNDITIGYEFELPTKAPKRSDIEA